MFTQPCFTHIIDHIIVRGGHLEVQHIAAHLVGQAVLGLMEVRPAAGLVLFLKIHLGNQRLAGLDHLHQHIQDHPQVVSEVAARQVLEAAVPVLDQVHSEEDKLHIKLSA